MVLSLSATGNSLDFIENVNSFSNLQSHLFYPFLKVLILILIFRNGAVAESKAIGSTEI